MNAATLLNSTNHSRMLWVYPRLSCVYLRIQSLSSTQAEDVLHVVEAGRLAGEEARGAHGALRVSSAARGAVRDLDALAGAGEKDGAVAARIAATRDPEADSPPLVPDGQAVAPENAVRLERVGPH